ncbi:TetR family transcriptional regulator [Streptomyces sp. WAC 06738]|uniref:TetR/AcrR family transcriptional regulator n=1 Tax=Streptomyces sp. WAC 06738 TaxID=2203210 RepID=UPI0019D260B8|nr:TetR family transcriptional regulator [Streptomyces sp. WAC 06738]
MESDGSERGGSRSTAAGRGVWLRKGPDRPGRASPLSQARIADAAVALLDEGGADRLTMRGLAQRLEVSATALYWHVASREDVLDLAFDHIFAQVPLPEPGPEWTLDVERLVVGWHAAMLRHPWSPALVGRPMLGPNVLARTEFLQSALVRGGLTGRALALATHLLANYAIGAALVEATWQRGRDPAVRAEAQAHLAARTDLYPTLNEHGHLDDRWPDEELFAAGVHTILGAVTHDAAARRTRRRP